MRISRFSNRSVGAKDPLSAAADLFRGSLDIGTALFVHENTTAFPAQSSFGLRPAYGETLPGHEGSR